MLRFTARLRTCPTRGVRARLSSPLSASSSLRLTSSLQQQQQQYSFLRLRTFTSRPSAAGQHRTPQQGSKDGRNDGKSSQEEQKGQEKEEEAGGRQNWYSRLLEAYPFTTTAVTSALITGAGDTISQCLFEEGPLDIVRNLKWVAIGGVFVAPLLFNWFRFLSRIFPGTGALSVGKRLAADQFLWAPPFVATFLCIIATIEGRMHEIPRRLEQSYLPAILTNWKLWIPAQIITFKFVPLRYQVLWVNCVALIWNTYLSWASHQELED